MTTINSQFPGDAPLDQHQPLAVESYEGDNGVVLQPLYRGHAISHGLLTGIENDALRAVKGYYAHDDFDMFKDIDNERQIEFRSRIVNEIGTQRTKAMRVFESFCVEKSGKKPTNAQANAFGAKFRVLMIERFQQYAEDIEQEVKADCTLLLALQEQVTNEKQRLNREATTRSSLYKRKLNEMLG